MDAVGFTLFDTAVGRCGAAWSSLGLRAVALPDGDDARTARRLSARVPAPADGRPTEPPAEVARALDGIAAHLDGHLDDLRWIALDHEGAPALHRRIWTLIREIPPGRTRTYGEIAVDLGDKALAQSVGQAMARNPTPIVAPCHRVLGAGGKAGGFSAPGGLSTKFRILQIEGAATNSDSQPTLFGALPLRSRA